MFQLDNDNIIQIINAKLTITLHVIYNGCMFSKHMNKVIIDFSPLRASVSPDVVTSCISDARTFNDIIDIAGILLYFLEELCELL